MKPAIRTSRWPAEVYHSRPFPHSLGPFQEPLYQLHIYFAENEVLAAH